MFQAICEGAGLAFFPASALTLRQFIGHCLAVGKCPAIIRRYLATIARAHLAAGLTSPCASKPVRLALKEMGQKTSARQRQARPLGWSEIERFLKTAGKGLRADRERALLCVAYDTMARRSELVALDVADLTIVQNFFSSGPPNVVSWGPPDFASSVPPDFGSWVPPAGRVLTRPRRSPEWSADVDVRVQMPISRGS